MSVNYLSEKEKNMRYLTDKERLKYIEKRVLKLIAANELFIDALYAEDFFEDNNKFKFIFKSFDKLLCQIMTLLGYKGDEFEL